MGWTRTPTSTSETARLRSNVFKGFGNDGVFLERLMYRVIMFNTMGVEDISSFSGSCRCFWGSASSVAGLTEQTLTGNMSPSLPSTSFYSMQRIYNNCFGDVIRFWVRQTPRQNNLQRFVNCSPASSDSLHAFRVASSSVLFSCLQF